MQLCRGPRNIEIGQIYQQPVSKPDIMQFLTNLFLIALQLKPTAGLIMIDNGLGLPVYGAEERIVDYALLAVDQKADLPRQVQAFCF